MPELPQHQCEKKEWGFIEVKCHPLDGWIFFVEGEPITEIDYCPWCGAELEPERRYFKAQQ